MHKLFVNSYCAAVWKSFRKYCTLLLKSKSLEASGVWRRLVVRGDGGYGLMEEVVRMVMVGLVEGDEEWIEFVTRIFFLCRSWIRDEKG